MTAKKSVYPAIRRKRSPREIRRSSPFTLTSHLPVGGLGRMLGRFFGRVDQVTDAAHGLDQLLLEAVVDLAPQVADIDVDNIRETVVVHVPHVLYDHRTAERTAPVAHHVFE